MDRLLSVSQAARMVGVPRRILQQHIQEGLVSTFEGYIRMSELHKAYPDVSGERSGMLEKVRLIREAAAFKDIDKQADPERLAAELHRARIQITNLQAQVEDFRELARDTENRLLELQAHCQRRESSLLAALISWYMNRLNLIKPS